MPSCLNSLSPNLDEKTVPCQCLGPSIDEWVCGVCVEQEWSTWPWQEVVAKMAEMTERMDQFALRIKKLPGRLRECVL